MQLDKIKGTLVDFNELEHVLDDMPRVGSWQIELRKANDDPMEVDELVLHISLADGGEESSVSKEITRCLFERAELHANRIVFPYRFRNAPASRSRRKAQGTKGGRSAT